MGAIAEGWPLTDPYPYRDAKWPPEDEKEVDCNFVVHDKECIETWTDKNEDVDYKYHLILAWKEINSLQKQLQQAKDNIKWLENVGGEKLNMACGFDIFRRDSAKRAEEAYIKEQ